MVSRTILRLAGAVLVGCLFASGAMAAPRGGGGGHGGGGGGGHVGGGGGHSGGGGGHVGGGGGHQAGPQPQFNNPAPRPQFNNPAPRPQFNNPGPRPQFNNPAPRPQFNNPAPRPQFNNPAPRPQGNAGPRTPYVNPGPRPGNQGHGQNSGQRPPVVNPRPPHVNPGPRPPVVNPGHNPGPRPPVVNPGHNPGPRPPVVNPGHNPGPKPPVVNPGHNPGPKPPVVNPGHNPGPKPPVVNPGHNPGLKPPVVNPGHNPGHGPGSKPVVPQLPIKGKPNHIAPPRPPANVNITNVNISKTVNVINVPRTHPRPPVRTFNTYAHRDRYVPWASCYTHNGFYYGGNYYNHRPFYAQTMFCPTPWIYFGAGCWFEVGIGYHYAPPVIQAPITVAVEEFMTVPVLDQFDNPMLDPITLKPLTRTETKLWYYNAVWYTGASSYGYTDYLGGFHWVTWP